MNLIGKVLADRYEILEEIGIGGMAVVYKARCRVLNRYVAIKVLREDLQNDAEFVKRFNVEAQAAASLTHPNIVSIFDVGSEDNIHYIVMEYVEGQTLKEYIEENKVLPWREAVDIAMQICKGLEVAHKNSIVHRDIKPHNIMRTPDGVIKVTDFGIARANFQKTMTVEDSAIGSVHYISPEQARGGFIDQRSDIYSLGIVLYEMLTGRVPFDNESPVTIAIKHLQEKPVPPSEYNISIPRPLELAVMKAIEKEPSMRYSSASEFCGVLSGILNDPERKTNLELSHDIDETRVYKPVEIPEKEISDEKEEVVGAGHGDDGKMSKGKTSKKPVKIDKNKERKVVALAITASLAVIFVILFAFASLTGITDIVFGDKGNVEVPKLVDMTYEKAVEMYSENGFNIVIGKEVESDKDSGTIISQNPEAGKKIKQSDEMVITVDVSAGSGEIILDSYLKYTDKRNVEIEMRKYGLEGEFIDEPSDTIPRCAIIRQVPKAGSSVKKGDTITFFVSTGPSESKSDEKTEEKTDEKTDEKPPQNPESNKGNEPEQGPGANSGTQTPEVQKKSSMLTVYGPRDKESALVQVKVNGNVVYSKNITNGSSEVVRLESTQSSVEVEILYDGVSKQKSTVQLH